MSNLMSHGDLAIGQFITIHSWHPIPVPNSDPFGLKSGEAWKGNSEQTYTPTAYLGDVMEVRAVCLPYIVVENWGTYPSTILRLDTRVLDLMELTPEYVKAIKDAYDATQSAVSFIRNTLGRK